MIYGKYYQKIHTKWKPFEKRKYKYYPVPGCMRHRQIVGDSRGRLLFTRYIDRPQKSHDLYWKTHKAEYMLILPKTEHIDPKKHP